MPWFTLFLIATAAWAMLRILGNEHERQLQEARVRAAFAPTPPPPSATVKHASPKSARPAAPAAAGAKSSSPPAPAKAPR